MEKISVSSTKQIIESCGRYRICKNIDADIEVAAYASFHSNTGVNPINSNSCMITTFSVPVGMDILIDAYYFLRRFFEYITYRKNIDIGDIEVFFKNEDGLRDYSGILVFPQKYVKETNKKVKDRIITYRLLTRHSSRLFTTIKNKMLGFQHLCNSIEDMRHYLPSRIIMILAEFEHEYRNIYGQDNGRSDEYLEVKNEVAALIESYYKSKHGNMRQYAKQLRKYVENRDSSFESNVKNALNDCELIMSPFVKRKYNGAYSDAIEGISSRMGEVRNGIAHSRLDLRFDAIHLSDIKIIEELVYVIRLRKIHMNSLECQKSINKLFDENFAF